MASQLNARHSARVVILLIAAFLLMWASVDARAQGRNTSSISTNGNSSWEQAIALLQAKVDQQAATIAQLQAALATVQANVTTQAAARVQGDADTLAAAKQYADSISSGASQLAAAKQYADAAVATGISNEAAARAAADATLQASINTEAAARQAADTTLQANINAAAAASHQADVDTLAAAKLYADTVAANEAAARQAAGTLLQNNINAEAAARASSDNALQSSIDSIQQSGSGGTVPPQLLAFASHLSVETGTINGLVGPHVILTGVNLHIRNGQPVQYDHTPTFPTASYLANGLGNLVVGYNDDEGIADISNARTGSHNLIIGDLHMFGASGALLAGWNNYIGANATAVSGGYSNGAGDFAASVSGGFSNWAVGQGSSVSGGTANIAEAEDSTVTGGATNHATGSYSSVAGGYANYAAGLASSVSGGANVTANGDYSTAP